MKNFFSLLLFLAFVSQAQAQGVPVFGTVRSALDETGLPGAHVVLTHAQDASVKAAVTDAEGKFRFERIAAGSYKMEVKYLGFANLSRTIEVGSQALNLGRLNLAQDRNTLQEVEIIGRVPLGEQKGDTTQYNAGAFKTAPDASAEDLVQKMPGITVENGRIQAQGEDVARILIDGKRYFGDDADAALRNLPADVIESIQILDKASDRAEISGFDDGNREKTINIVTKPDRRKGYFGKASAGYGTDDRYMVGATINLFDNEQRLTITGLTNNINLFDFSVGETPGGGMRGRRGGRGGGSPNGITNTNTFSLNYSDMWFGDKAEVSGTYSFNQRDNFFRQTRFQDFIQSSEDVGPGQIYNETRDNNTANLSHNFNFRFDYRINENNRLLITPRFSATQSEGAENFLGRFENAAGPINQTINNTNYLNSGLNFNNNIHFSHRFPKKGRSFSTSLQTGFNQNDGNQFRLANDIYFTQADRNRTIDQNTRQNRTGYEWEGEVSYTEPVGQYGQLELEYEIGNNKGDIDRRTYNRAEQTGEYMVLDTLLSNTFRSDYLTQEFETGYQYNKDNLRLQVEVGLQQAQLKNNQVFPQSYVLNRTFRQILPSTRLEYKFSENKNLNIDYRAGANAPSINQLQEVVDNSNTLRVRIGNPELDQTYDNRFRVRYRSFTPETNKTFFAGLFGNFTQNYITNSTTILQDPLPLASLFTRGQAPETGDTLGRGGQLIRPVNLDGFWSVRSFVSYGQPLPFLRSNLNLRGFAGFNRIPGLINDVQNFANATNMGMGLTLSSNISERVDFTLSSNSSYNIVSNTLRPGQFNNSFSQNTSLRYNMIFWEGLVYRTELNHTLNSGLSQGFNVNYLLWNMSIGKKIFKNQQGEISLSVNDLLKQNVSVQRNVTDLFIEDVQTTVLQRFFMITFTYNLRHFSGGEVPDFNQGNDRRGGWNR